MRIDGFEGSSKPYNPKAHVSERDDPSLKKVRDTYAKYGVPESADLPPAKPNPLADGEKLSKLPPYLPPGQSS